LVAINCYLWLLYWLLLMVITIYCIISYIITIGDYYIKNNCWMFYVIIS
jgi:hypothetical protein